MGNEVIVLIILIALGFAFIINKLNTIQEGIGLLVSMQLSELIEMDEENGVVMIKIKDEDKDNG